SSPDPGALPSTPPPIATCSLAHSLRGLPDMFDWRLGGERSAFSPSRSDPGKAPGSGVRTPRQPPRITLRCAALRAAIPLRWSGGVGGRACPPAKARRRTHGQERSLASLPDDLLREPH